MWVLFLLSTATPLAPTSKEWFIRYKKRTAEAVRLSCGVSLHYCFSPSTVEMLMVAEALSAPW